MDWLIWVIVIVLVVAIVWWLASRNSTKTSPAAPPAATEPGNSSSVPDTAVAASGVAGLAGVTNLGREAAEGSGPAPDDAAAEVEARRAQEEEQAVAEAPGGANEPVIDSPVLEEPVVDEPVVDTGATVESAGEGDVDEWESAAPRDAERKAGDEAADKAEWEASWTDAAGAPVHHHEYTGPHSPTLPGAETAAAEEAAESAPAATGHLAADHPYGQGSAAWTGDGNGPEGYPVKGDAATMTYHDEDTSGYADAAADVWFESAAHAEAAGFRPPRRSRH